MSFNFFSRQPSPHDPVRTAINEFSKLRLGNKIDCIGTAIVKLERELEKNGRRLGHPGDWPRDYHSTIGRYVLGLVGGNPEQENEEVIFSISCSAQYLIERSKIPQPGFNMDWPKYSMGNILVISSNEAAGGFLGIINIYEYLDDSTDLSINIDKIVSYRPLVEHFLTHSAFASIFIASSSITHSRSAYDIENESIDRACTHSRTMFFCKGTEKSVDTFAIEWKRKR